MATASSRCQKAHSYQEIHGKQPSKMNPTSIVRTLENNSGGRMARQAGQQKAAQTIRNNSYKPPGYTGS
jgi:hypothetical protein